jgi:hypothetical protein
MEKQTAKEKAIELVDSFNNLAKDFTRGVSMNEFAIQCALITVDEILKKPTPNQKVYWQQVKNEIFKSETIVTEFRDGTVKVETFKKDGSTNKD